MWHEPCPTPAHVFLQLRLSTFFFLLGNLIKTGARLLLNLTARILLLLLIWLLEEEDSFSKCPCVSSMKLSWNCSLSLGCRLNTRVCYIYLQCPLFIFMVGLLIFGLTCLVYLYVSVGSSVQYFLMFYEQFQLRELLGYIIFSALGGCQIIQFFFSSAYLSPGIFMGERWEGCDANLAVGHLCFQATRLEPLF